MDGQTAPQQEGAAHAAWAEMYEGRVLPVLKKALEDDVPTMVLKRMLSFRTASILLTRFKQSSFWTALIPRGNGENTPRTHPHTNTSGIAPEEEDDDRGGIQTIVRCSMKTLASACHDRAAAAVLLDLGASRALRDFEARPGNFASSFLSRTGSRYVSFCRSFAENGGGRSYSWKHTTSFAATC